MSSDVVKRAAAALVILSGMIAGSALAEEVRFRKPLTAVERHCLGEILKHGHWRLTPQFHQEMIAAAVVGRPNLKGNGGQQYIFAIPDSGSCGTAGCTLLIAEKKHGKCHEIYDDAGSDTAVTVLRERDHDYRRLLTPCEARFDGREYHKIHDECPNADVHR